MKKILLTFLLAVPVLNYAQSDKVLDFKIAYAPEMSYHQIVEQSSETELHYIASPEILERLKNQGIENPTLGKTLTLMESAFKTGKPAKDGYFPVTIKFLKSTNSDNKTIIPDGTLIYGKASASTMPTLDSIVSKDLDAAFKSTLLQTMQSMFSQIALPEKKLKVGESFIQETPLSIPIAGTSIDMKITTTYKLINMTNQIANFDIVQQYTMNLLISEGQYKVTADGGGTGKLIYDIPNHFSTSFKLDIGLNFDLKQDKFSLKVKSNSGFNQTVKVSKL